MKSTHLSDQRPNQASAAQAAATTTPARDPSSIDKIFGNLGIGSKLSVAFGILVVLTLLISALSYLGSAQASFNLSRTRDLRVPTVNASSSAKAPSA